MAATKSFFDRIWHKKYSFLFVYFIVFTLSYLVLVAIDFVPEPVTTGDVDATDTNSELVEEDELLPDDDVEETAETVESSEDDTAETVLPVSIHFERLGKTIDVLNPRSRGIAELDAALLDGAVRHPDSARLGQDGNVFILGHSSYLPNVFNENYQAFNGIQNLEWGDTIEVSSGDQVFVYRVEKVYEARAQELVVPIAGDDKRLTLATCDSFGSADDRFIVEAVQIEVRAA